MIQPKNIDGIVRVMVVAAVMFTAQSVAAATCESLSSLKLPDTTITTAQSVAAGAFKSAGGGGRGGGNQFADLPAFCQVAATLKPTSDSDIKIELWLPASGWNGKFQAVGNGGWNGNVDQNALATGLRRGYATASTDTGHSGGGGPWMQNQEKLVDYGHRAVHEMTVKAKALINEFYGSPAKLSYFNGCSAGGRQGLKAAQKYPDDFDGIVAGAPALNATGRAAFSMFVAQNLRKEEGSYIPATKYAAINTAVLQACDGLDGVKDGVIDQPDHCSFDPSAMQCKADDGPSCLTPSQVETARAMYGPVKDPKTGVTLSFPMLHPGSELNWATLAGPQPYLIASEAYRYVVFNDPAWDPASFDASTDIARLERQAVGIEPPSTNLKPFFSRGGKLLMYHGWADQQVAPLNSTTYFDAVVKESGKDAAGKSIALYLVPGMGHCQGGAGTDAFDKVAAMEEWISTGAAPKQIVASHRTSGATDRTRPLCQYPQVAKYKGSGSTDDASNFVCAAGR